jgi:hypothetical protein
MVLSTSLYKVAKNLLKTKTLSHEERSNFKRNVLKMTLYVNTILCVLTGLVSAILIMYVLIGIIF